MPKDFPFKIGADPEFTIIFRDKTIRAKTLMESIFEKKYKKNSDMGYAIKNAGEIGWDGAAATAELRPAPVCNPYQLTKNIRTLLEAFSEKTKLYCLTTMSDKAPIGGHIHLEINNDEYLNSERKRNNLNKKISSFYTPIMIGEDIVNIKSRMKRGYGEINDHRSERKSEGKMTIELRAPTAEWLTTPEVATATLAYLATVYHEIVSHPKNFNKAKEIIIQSELQNKALQDLALTRYLPITKMLTSKIKKYIKTFEYYKYYKKEIDFILSPQKIINEKRKAKFDIMRGWELADFKEPTKRMLLSEKQLQNESLKVDVDQMMGLISMQYNPDVNISEFVKAIKQRTIALNWNLKNEYYFYGLKPKIKDYIIVDKKAKFYSGGKTIKTILDYLSIEDTTNRMSSRFHNNQKVLPQNHIIIGIPYEERIKLNTKKFIEIIYDLEKNNIKPKKILESKLIDDRNLDINQTGVINQIYNNQDCENLELDACETSENEELTQRIRNEENINTFEENINTSEGEDAPCF